MENNTFLMQDGTIFAWKYNVSMNSFEPAASLKGHSSAVVTLVVGANKVYSGSMDTTIRVSFCIFFLYNKISEIPTEDLF